MSAQPAGCGLLVVEHELDKRVLSVRQGATADGHQRRRLRPRRLAGASTESSAGLDTTCRVPVIFIVGASFQMHSVPGRSAVAAVAAW
jgi:hypothetical protein